MRLYAPLLSVITLSAPPSQLSRIECDGNAGVEVVLAETSYSLRDVHHHGDSPAMQRLSRIHATGFGAGDPWDNLSPAFSWWSGGAPVMRVRVTKLAYVHLTSSPVSDLTLDGGSAAVVIRYGSYTH
jgi:hypothetical protein